MRRGGNRRWWFIEIYPPIFYNAIQILGHTRTHTPVCICVHLCESMWECVTQAPLGSGLWNVANTPLLSKLWLLANATLVCLCSDHFLRWLPPSGGSSLGSYQTWRGSKRLSPSALLRYVGSLPPVGYIRELTKASALGVIILRNMSLLSHTSDSAVPLIVVNHFSVFQLIVLVFLACNVAVHTDSSSDAGLGLIL